MQGFEEYKKKRYPYHYYPPVFESMGMAKDVEDAYLAGMTTAANRSMDILAHEIHMDHSDVHDLEQRVCDTIEAELIRPKAG